MQHSVNTDDLRAGPLVAPGLGPLLTGHRRSWPPVAGTLPDREQGVLFPSEKAGGGAVPVLTLGGSRARVAMQPATPSMTLVRAECACAARTLGTSGRSHCCLCRPSRRNKTRARTTQTRRVLFRDILVLGEVATHMWPDVPCIIHTRERFTNAGVPCAGLCAGKGILLGWPLTATILAPWEVWAEDTLI